MLYLCQSILLRTYTEFQDEQIRICETPEVLKEKKYRDNSIVGWEVYEEESADYASSLTLFRVRLD